MIILKSSSEIEVSELVNLTEAEVHEGREGITGEGVIGDTITEVGAGVLGVGTTAGVTGEGATGKTMFYANYFTTKLS